MAQLYWYKMKRPMGPGSQPKGMVQFDGDIEEYGVIAYNRKLTEDEKYEYEIKEYNNKG